MMAEVALQPAIAKVAAVPYVLEKTTQWPASLILSLETSPIFATVRVFPQFRLQTRMAKQE